ncbi:MAG TPA: hypothetical protein VKV26_12905 [Dehalococcoidia bacterium]|nr:hypothetical protein [Dehalococcoidia bacterium]
MTTMSAARSGEAVVRGEVQCLNCGRTLGRATRNVGDGKITIRPFRSGQEIGVERQAGRGLRCKRCGGRAFLEFDAATLPAA